MKFDREITVTTSTRGPRSTHSRPHARRILLERECSHTWVERDASATKERLPTLSEYASVRVESGGIEFSCGARDGMYQSGCVREGLVKDKIKAMPDTILVSQSVEVASGRHGPDHHRSPDRCRSHRPVTTGCQGSSKSIPSSDGTSRGSSTNLCTCRISIGLLVEGYRSDQAS